MYPEEAEAVEAVRLGFSLAEAAELVGCSKSAVAAWVGASGPARPASGGRVYLPHDVKTGLVARYEAGERAADLGREVGVTGRAVTNWARRLREEGVLSLMTGGEVRARAPEPAEPPSELEEPRRRRGELEPENAILRGTVDILKKDPGADPSALTRAERAALAESPRDEFGLARVLGALALPRGTFYHQPARSRRPDPYAAARPLVRAAFEASGGAYGPARVWAELGRGEGEPQRARGAASLDPSRPVRVSEKAVRRIMREEGLEARAAAPADRACSSYAGEEGMAGAPNLLLADAARDLHDFSADRPGERLVTDITEFRLPDGPGKVYLSARVDLFDGDVVAFSAGPGPSKALVAEMLGGAAAAVGGGGSVYDTIRGRRERLGLAA